MAHEPKTALYLSLPHRKKRKWWMKMVTLSVKRNTRNNRGKAGSTCGRFKTSSGASPPWWLHHKKARLQRAFFYIHSFFCLPNKRKNQRKIHLRCFSISSEIAKKLGASKTSFAVQSKVSALFPIFYQILREKQRGHFFSFVENI